MHRDAFDDVLEADRARLLGEDREGVRIPLDQDLARLDLLAVLDPQVRAVDDLVALALAALVVLTTMWPLRFITMRSLPSRSAPLTRSTTARLSKRTVPLCLASSADCSDTRDAVPPMWNVRIVSCVPGSPIDCAAMMPTAMPSSTSLPVARSRP